MVLSSPIIVCAAIKNGYYIIASARHYDKVMNKARFVYADTKSKDFKWHWEQGFIDQHNVFYTREEAMKIVLSNDQPFNLKRNGGDITKLYSEGLY